MSTNLSSTYSNQDIVLHVGDKPKDVEATKGEVRYTKNKVESEVEIKTDQKKTLGTLELVRFFFNRIHIIMSPLRRKGDILF